MPDEEEEFREFRPFCILLASNPSPQVEDKICCCFLPIKLSAVIIYYLKALAGLRKLTDRSPEKRLEPLQEHLTFPALIYLRFCQGLCLSCKLIWIANNQEANAGGELHHLCAGLCLLSLLKNTIDRFLCGERPAKVYSPSFQSIYLSALLVLSSCLFLVGSKDVVASEGLILAVIKTASSIIQVKAQENLNLANDALSRLPPVLCWTPFSPPCSPRSPTWSSSPCNGRRLTRLQI